MKMKRIFPLVKATFREFGSDKVLRLSAALAYYAMFSIGPLLVIAVGLAGLAFGSDSVRHQIQQQLQSTLGENSAKTVESMMVARQQTSIITTVLGAIALIFGATGVFGQLQDSLNTIWKVKAKPGKGVWAFVRSRFLSLTMVLGIGFLLLVSLALTTFLSSMMGSVSSRFAISETLAHILNLVVSFAVISVLFGMIFKFLPDVKIPFRNVWMGAVVTAFLFTIGKYLLSLYLGRESTASAYGAAGSVILVLMWIYYASVILFLGAEFTYVYTKDTGTKIVPTKYAEPVMQEQRAREGMSARPGTAGVNRPQAAAVFAHSPGGVIRREPWQFFMLMLTAGFAGRFLFRPGGVRKLRQRLLR
jgi:membrane protein